MFAFEAAILILVAAVCILLNRQFAEVGRKFQKSVLGFDYELRLFRIPLYIVGGIFLVIGIARIFSRYRYF
jgi:hypothetical protein